MVVAVSPVVALIQLYFFLSLSVLLLKTDLIFISSIFDTFLIHVEQNHLEIGERIIEEAVRPKRSDPTPSLINLTKNLAINSYPLKSGAVKNPTENSVPPTSASKAI